MRQPPPARDTDSPRASERSPGASSIRVAVTRPEPLKVVERAYKAREVAPAEDPLVQAIRAEGLIPVRYPLLRVESEPWAAGLRAAFGRFVPSLARSVQPSGDRAVSDWQAERCWLLLTSANAVAAVHRALESDFEILRSTVSDGTVRVGVVGRGTAAAARAVGLHVSLVPEPFRAAELLRALIELEGGTEAREVKVLIPQSDEGAGDLPAGLRKVGIRVDAVSAYSVVPEPREASRLVDSMKGAEVDVVSFTSGSALRALHPALGSSRWPSGVRSAVIGPVTAAVAREHGYPVDIESAEATFRGLAAAIAQGSKRAEQVRHSDATEKQGRTRGPQ